MAHSLGGLVVKKVNVLQHNIPNNKAIIEAYNDSMYVKLLADIKGIVFFGTPHRGSDLAPLLSNLLSAILTERIFIEQLQPGSETIKEINHAFRDRTLSIHLVSFTESTAMRPVGV